jgi:hypothetical protein
LKILIYIQKNVSRVMRELKFTVIQLQQSAGRLSSVLIPPYNLSKMLQGVTLRLPQDVSLIACCNVENMYVYYEVEAV